MASFVDNIVSEIRKVPAGGDYKALATKLKQYADQLSKTELSVLDNILDCLDITTHSLGVLTVL